MKDLLNALSWFFTRPAVISAIVSLLVSGMAAPFANYKLNKRNRKMAFSEEDTVKAIDELITRLTEVDQLSYMSVIVTISFLNQHGLQDEEEKESFLKNNSEKFSDFHDSLQKLHIAWGKYSTHFDDNTQNKLKQYFEMIDENNDVISDVIFAISENENRQPNGKLSGDNGYNANKIIDELFKKRNEIMA